MSRDPDVHAADGLPGDPVGDPPDWRPGAITGALRLRAGLYAHIRDFFAARKVLEVETPVLSAAGNTDPNIESFALDFGAAAATGAHRRWLRTSPEHALKRLLAAGCGDCYELGRVFRDGEVGVRHNPEFTMLEWYRVGWDHHRLMAEAAELVREALALAGRSVELQTLSYRELYVTCADIDPFEADTGSLRDALSDYRIEADGLQRDDWLDLLMSHRIQPAIPDDRLLIVHDYPASQCAQAHVDRGPPPFAERFELYVGPLEIANGYRELGDADELRRRLLGQRDVRLGHGRPSPPVDARLLGALAAGLPDSAGVALGVDRLLMAMLGTRRIADVLAFDFARA